MRLAIVSPSFGRFGGIEAFVCALAAEIQASHEISVSLVFKKARGFKLEPLLEKNAYDTGANIVYADRASAPLIKAISTSDVVHCQNPCVDVAVVSKLLLKPLVLTIHNYRRSERSLRSVGRSIAFRLANRRWYNSSFVWDTWESPKRFPASAKLPVLSNLPEGIVPVSHRKGFVFIARWIANKGLDTLIDAYACANLDRNSWPLILMGDGPLRPLMLEKIKSLNVHGIQVLGRVDDQVRNNIIRHSRWMVTPPNTNEDMGLTPFEARHVGVPCIVTRDGGLPEAAGSHALVCEPGDVEGLKTLLEQAAHMDDHQYSEISHASYHELMDSLQPLSVYIPQYFSLLNNNITG
jgi:glycosyltransferase involved in cell wall biosynthesis